METIVTTMGRPWAANGWAVFLAGGLVVSAAVGLSGSSDAVGVAVQLTGWASVAIGVRIARRSPTAARRTWLCFAGAASCFLIGGLGRSIHGSLIGIERPFPSPADTVLFVGHGLLITGSIALGHLRSPDRNRSAFIDGAILAAGAATPVWALVLWPYVTDASVSDHARALNGVYALLTAILLACIGRLAVGPGARSLSYRLLAIAVALIFVQDMLVTLEYVGGPKAGLGRALAPFIFVFFGAAALHPDLPSVTEAHATLGGPLTRRRILLLASALAVNPLIVALQVALDRPPALFVAAVSTIVISALVLARLIHLVRAQALATAQEQSLRQANARLALAPDRMAMLNAALDAVIDLAGRRDDVRASVLGYGAAGCHVVASAGTDSELAAHHRVDDQAWIAEAAADAWAAVTPREVTGPPVDLPPSADRAPACQYAVELGAPQTPRATLVVSASALLPLPTRQAIADLATTTSLALETAELTEALQRSRSEQRFRALVENSSDLIVVVNQDRSISFVSPASRRLLGRDEDSLIASSSSILPLGDDVGLLDDVLDRATGSTFTQPIEMRLRHADGSPRWFEVAARDLTADAEVDGLVLNCREVSDRKDAELRLFRSEARFRALVQNVSDVVAVIDDWGRFTYVSPAITRLLGYRAEQLLDTPATTILASDQRHDAQDLLLEALRMAADTTHPQSIELRAIALDGGVRTLDVTVSDLRHDPAVQGVVLNARDVTVRKQLESTLRHQAHHDALTGLANRTRFAELVDTASAEGNGSACVLFVDLDDFKTVNDSLGHAVGDDLLIAVANRLSTHLPAEATSARLGGDEFAVLVRPSGDDLGPVGVALRLLHELRSPFEINGWDIVVTASIGIAAIGTEGTTSEVVLRNADMAMYLAKERGKDRVELFEEAMHVTAFERLELKADLARAITSGQLSLVYQPVVALETGRITGAEALVRWDHPRRGRLSPDAFIAIAEETGLIVQLGQWVLEEACQQLRNWQLTLPPDAALSLSVNLSVRQLEQPSIVDAVRDAVDQFALDPSTLTLEITETVIIDHMETDRGHLTALKDLGVQIALDDFGVGYSSLRYADDLPVDVLKVDRSFVGGIIGTEVTPVLEAIVALGRRLGVHIVAEGIERAEQVTALKEIGCDLGQGYLFSPPLHPEAFADLLARNLARGGFATTGFDGPDMSWPGERS